MWGGGGPPCGGPPGLSKPWELGGDAMPCCVPGTPRYIPPEWFTMKSYRADSLTVWQLGVLLFEMLTGQILYRTEGEIVWKVIPRIRSEISPSEEHNHTDRKSVV